MLKRSALVVTLGLSWSCGGGNAETAPAAVAPEEAAGPDIPNFGLPEGEENVSLEQAQAMVERVERDWGPPADHPLRTPQDLDDVEAILKLDQNNLYAPAIELAARTKGVRSLGLEAQIELAWGESYSLLMQLLLRLSQVFDKRSMPLEQKRELSSSEGTRLARLRAVNYQTSRLMDAFTALSQYHSGRGLRRANELIEKHPDSYLGYRIAADYYRTVRRWEMFDIMLGKIEEKNPNSNGLVFLKGAAALQRDEDRETASEYYRQALDTDPEFIRAQAHLVLAQQRLSSLYEEFKRLEELNPNHPMIKWVGAIMEVMYQDAKRR